MHLTCGFNRWTHQSPLGPLPMLPPDVPAQYDELGNEVAPALVRSGSPTHWKVSGTECLRAPGEGRLQVA